MKIVKIYQNNESIKKNFNKNEIASDKSISHRSVMFSLLANGKSVVRNFLKAEDTLNSLEIVKQLGGEVEEKNGEIHITSSGNIKEPSNILDCGNSGTSMRLFSGFLSAQEGSFVLTGDKYLRRRPMKRITQPLKQIGAFLDGRKNGELAPLFIRGGKIKAFDYESQIPSAQVKSALILAGLFANGTSYYKEPELSRDHTERMLSGMGVSIKTEDDGKIKIDPIASLEKGLKPLDITVPVDPSSAFFFVVLATITKGSKITFTNMLLNPTRTEAFRVLQRMGANITITETDSKYETIGTVTVEYSKLKATTVEENISWLIDEIPALAVAMAVAEGTSYVKNAKELKVKESDRIETIVENMKVAGIEAEANEDGFSIKGGEFVPAVINSYGDHRIAMSFAVAGTLVGMKIEDIDCVNTSFPNFFEILGEFTKIEVDAPSDESIWR
jgi:3-phosphoshikimate 1-carboxyvinyltransferase